jgi:hypothetical protein
VSNLQNIEVAEVKTKQQLNSFTELPYALYKNDLNWVPPLRITQSQILNSRFLFWKKNPHCFFIAKQNGKCVGRIVAFINKAHNEFLKRTDGFFGFLEAENNEEVFQKLLHAVIEFLKAQGCTKIIGPMNPDIHNELGILVKGFDSPPFFMLTHHYPYYNEMLIQQELSKYEDFYSYKMDSTKYVPSTKMERVGKMLMQKYQLKIRTPDMKKFMQELEYFHDIYNDAFVDHWGFVPIPKDEFLLLAKDMKSIIDPRLVLILEYNNEPIAFLLTLPNANELFIKIKNGRLLPTGIFKILFGRKHIKTARVITAAVKKKYQHLGLGALLYPELMKRGIEYGYKEAELSWVAEDNIVMNTIAKELCGGSYKTYRLYSKNI